MAKTTDWDRVLRQAISSGITLEEVASTTGVAARQVAIAVESKLRFHWAKCLEGYHRHSSYVQGKELPAIPKLKANGSYDPKELLKFMERAKAVGLHEAHIANLLAVYRHRVLYFLRDGLTVLRSRASQ